MPLPLCNGPVCEAVMSMSDGEYLTNHSASLLTGLNLLEKEQITTYFTGFVGHLWKINKVHEDTCCRMKERGSENNEKKDPEMKNVKTNFT